MCVCVSVSESVCDCDCVCARERVRASRLNEKALEEEFFGGRGALASDTTFMIAEKVIGNFQT